MFCLMLKEEILLNKTAKYSGLGLSPGRANLGRTEPGRAMGGWRPAEGEKQAKGSRTLRAVPGARGGGRREELAGDGKRS